MIKEFYVSPLGSDCNDGSVNNPFASIVRARNEIRKIDKSKFDGIYVNFNKGRYFFDNTIELLPEDSGTESCPVFYKANDGDKVYFDGGIILNPKDAKKLTDKNIVERIIERKAVSHIFEIDLKPYGIKEYGKYGTRGFRRTYVSAPNELYIDTQSQSVAKYPTDGSIFITEENVLKKGSVPNDKDFSCKPFVFKYDNKRLEKWKSAKGAYIGGFFASTWADDCIEIKEINIDEKTITPILPHLFGLNYGNNSLSWYIVNLLEELSSQGEYFVDTQNEMLYFYPKNDITDSFIQLSVLDKVMISCEEASYIRFEGFTFENSRNTGIYIEGGNNIKIKSCVFRNLGNLAIQIGQGAEPMRDGYHTHHGDHAPEEPRPVPMSRDMGNWHEFLYEFAAWDNNGGKNHVVQNCEIYNTGTGGMLLSGGNRKKLISGNNRVHNCHFYNVNRLDKTYKAAINVMGVGNIISHCHIHDLPGMAIYLHGNDHIIEFNKIHDVLTHVSDSGAIYMGRDQSEVGNVFQYNFIYNIIYNIINPHKEGLGVCAIYFDDSCIYNMVYSNIFYNIVSDGQMFFSPVYWTHGGMTSIGNNTYIDCFPSTNPNTGYNAYETMHSNKLSIKRVHTVDENDISGVDITSSVYREKYPYLYQTYVNDFQPGTQYWNNDVYINQYEYFVDKDSLNFQYTDERQKARDEYLSPVKITDVVFGYKKQRVPYKKVDFNRIGIVNDEEY